LNFSGESLRGDEFSSIFSRKIFELSQVNDLTIPKYDLAKEVVSQKEAISDIEKKIIKQPFHEIGDLKKLKRLRNKVGTIEIAIEEKKILLEKKENYNWEKFTNLMKILNYFGCLEDVNITDIGDHRVFRPRMNYGLDWFY